MGKELRHFDILLRGHRPEKVLPMRIAAVDEAEARKAAVAQVELDQDVWKRYEWLGEVEGVTGRLEYLRGELRAERISMGELAELQGLADEIDPGDVELLEAAGVPEFPDDNDTADAATNRHLSEHGRFTIEG